VLTRQQRQLRPPEKKTGGATFVGWRCALPGGRKWRRRRTHVARLSELAAVPVATAKARTSAPKNAPSTASRRCAWIVAVRDREPPGWLTDRRQDPGKPLQCCRCRNARCHPTRCAQRKDQAPNARNARRWPQYSRFGAICGKPRHRASPRARRRARESGGKTCAPIGPAR